MSKTSFMYVSDNGCTYIVDPVRHTIDELCPIKDISKLPADLVDAIKAAKFEVYVDGKTIK